MKITKVISNFVVAAVLLMSSSIIFGQNSELKLNEIIERELLAGQTHEYEISLRAGEFLQIRVEQKGIDVWLQIFSKDKTLIAEMDSPNGSKGLEAVSMIAAQSGKYQLKVQPAPDFQGERGKYAVKLITKSNPDRIDHQRIELEKKFLKSSRELSAHFNSGSPTNKTLQALAQQKELFLKSIPEWREQQETEIVELIELFGKQLDEAVKLLEDLKINEADQAARADKEAKKKAADAEQRNSEQDFYSRPQLIIPNGHNGIIESMDFSPDGKTLATSGHHTDQSVKLWDLSTNREVKELQHGADVEQVEFSPDGEIFICLIQHGINKLIVRNAKTGAYLNSIDGTFGSNIISFAFSPDGKTIAAAHSGGAIRLLEIKTGKEIKVLKNHFSFASALAFSPDGKMLASGAYGDENNIKLWDVAGGTLIKTLPGEIKKNNSPGSSVKINALKFSPDGQTLLSGGGFGDKTIKIWNINSGTASHILPHAELSRTVFSHDGKKIASASYDKTLKLWDAVTGKELWSQTLSISASSLAFSPNDATLAVATYGKVDFIETATPRRISSLEGRANRIKAASFSPDAKTIAVADNFGSPILWNLSINRRLRTNGSHSKIISQMIFSPDGKTLVTGSWDTKIKLWDVAAGNHQKTFSGHLKPINGLACSSDNRLIASSAEDARVKLWDAATGEQLRDFPGHDTIFGALAFSPDGKLLAYSGGKNELIIWDTLTGEKLKSIKSDAIATRIAFSPDGKKIGVESYRFKVWDVDTGNEDIYEKIPDWKESQIDSITSLPNQKKVRVEIMGNKVVWRDADSEREIAALIFSGQNDWAVVDRDNRWDASDGAQKMMYYTIAAEKGYEVIEFSQLKERYYEPNLLVKLLGQNQESLRSVAQFKSVLLPPAIEPLKPINVASTVRQVKIKNRQGGIGRVQIFVNGREFIEDARDAKLKANPHLSEYVLSFDLKGAAFIPGEIPDVRVVAWNFDPRAREKYQGYVSSRGVVLAYTPPVEKIEPPTLYAIIGGVSDYSGDKLDLRFAAKDAADIYTAIKVGGKNLFGVERVKLKLLATGEHPEAAPPTKENFRQAFAEFAAVAKPNDVFFVYLAGHGITLNFGSDTYYYLTGEAATTDKETLSKDSALLASSTINSEELTQWHKSVKAQKQSLVLDTCAAGALGKEFNLAEKRDLSTDAKRALEKMRDRVSFHVLMGSAADAPSYEASQYGQGLLTYSLLQGMKGAALQPDGTIDVSKLFNYAADYVPGLAKNIGGIQKPEIRVPIGGTSFAFGLISNEADKRSIPLALVKPIILRPSVQNEDIGDELNLENLLRDNLRQSNYTAARGIENAGFVFVDTDEMPDAIRPFGRYSVRGAAVTVTLKLFKNGKPASAAVSVTGETKDLPALILKIKETVSAEAQKLNFAP